MHFYHSRGTQNIANLILLKWLVLRRGTDGTDIKPNISHNFLLDFIGSFLSNVFLFHGFNLRRQIRKIQLILLTGKDAKSDLYSRKKSGKLFHRGLMTE